MHSRCIPVPLLLALLAGCGHRDPVEDADTSQAPYAGDAYAATLTDPRYDSYQDFGTYVAWGARRSSQLAAYWFASGSTPRRYSFRFVRDSAAARGYQAIIRSLDTTRTANSATVMQFFRAADYRTRRVRFSAELRTHDAFDGASVWMGIDDACGQLLAFDSGMARAVTSPDQWTRRSVVLDIPAEAFLVSFGIQLRGSGEVRARRLEFAVVDRTMATTANAIPDHTPGSNCATPSTAAPRTPGNLLLEPVFVERGVLGPRQSVVIRNAHR